MGGEQKMKIEQLSSYQEDKEKSDKLISCILCFAQYFEHHMRVEPTVIISQDMLAAIAKGNRDAIELTVGKQRHTICGYAMELAVGENVLYIGYRINESR
jgi:hypothetical protein